MIQLPSSARKGRLPVIHQAEAAECGIVCLAMIASYHGHHLDVNQARHRFPVSLMGTSLKTIVGFAGSFGFSTRALRAEPSHLSSIICPAILHVDMNHFVVLKEMRGDDAVVHDPASGVRRLTAKQLDRRFTGVVLELSPNDRFQPRKAEPKAGLRQLLGQVPVDSRAWPQALLLSLALQLLVLAAPLFVQLAIDRSVAQGDPGALAPLAIGFSLLILLRVAVSGLRAKVMLAMSGFLDARLVARLVHHMLRLPHSWFASRHVSVLLTRVTSTQPIRDLVADGLILAVVDGTMAVVTIAVAIWFAPALALVVLAGFLCAALLKAWQVRRSMSREHEFIEAFAQAQQEFIETARGIATIKLFRKEADREARWNDAHVESVNARYSVDAIRMTFDIGRDAIQALVVIAIVFIGATQVLDGAMTLGTLMAFVAYQQTFATSAGSLLDFIGRFKLLDLHLERVADVILAETEPEEASGLWTARTALEGSIAVEGLCFRYGAAEHPVVNNISFAVEAGEFVAITGASGGGKTTLIKLLTGLLEPTGGRILYDGLPLKKLGLANLRDQIGVVMQDDLLLSGSLAQNITFYDRAPDLDWMDECARLAAIQDDISGFPMGYHTLVGDMGTVLSGGQRQRVLLARALYKRPRILFMDEGTSSLDSEREREVNANLKSMRITRLIIAHRRETIAAADRVLELTASGLFERTRKVQA